VDENDAQKSIRKVRQPATNEMSVYRGWMMSPAKYQSLYDALRNRGIELINDPKSYKHCHYLPDG
jgi:hypothetical protein